MSVPYNVMYALFFSQFPVPPPTSMVSILGQIPSEQRWIGETGGKCWGPLMCLDLSKNNVKMKL